LDLKDEVNEDTLAVIFDFKHHLTAATEFFKTFAGFGRHTRAVIFGHKNQGKTQFLFFLTKLLQALGEGVVYLDPDVSLEKGKFKEDDDAEEVENNLTIWRGQLETFLDKQTDHDTVKEVKEKLDEFAKNANSINFKGFRKVLSKFVKKESVRVWLIVDETAKYHDMFDIPWPTGQGRDLFHFVLTGSKGISSFVGKRSLKAWVWDLPVFSPNETAVFAVKLAQALELPLEDLYDALGVKVETKKGGKEEKQAGSDGADDDVDAHADEKYAELYENLGARLEELFGGVLGYTAECLLGLKKGESLTDYALQLKSSGSDSSVLGAMKAAAKGDHNLEALCKAWFNLINRRDSDWGFLRDAGLCGSGAPRGVILRFVLENIYDLYAKDKGNALLNLVQKLQGELPKDDAGFQGNLLELETILQCKRGSGLFVVLLTLNHQQK
jgi:hypothetical protein